MLRVVVIVSLLAVPVSAQYLHDLHEGMTSRISCLKVADEQVTHLEFYEIAARSMGRHMDEIAPEHREQFQAVIDATKDSAAAQKEVVNRLLDLCHQLPRD